MARSGVTYTEVSNAANQLISAGKSPTIEAIRHLLGTGSNSTIGAHFRAWKAKRDNSHQITTKENLPEELVAALRGIWEWVMDKSDEKIQLIEQKAQEDLEKLNQEIQSLQKANTHWQQQYQNIKQEREGLASENAAITQLLNNAKIEISVLNEKQTGIELQCKEKQARIDELHQQNQRVQANLEHYRAASLEQRTKDQQRHEQQQKQLEQMVKQANQERAEAQRERTVLIEKNQKIDFENNSLKTQLEKNNIQYESISTRFTDALSELAKKSQEQLHWQTQFKTLQAKYEEENKSLIELKMQHAIILQQLDALKIECNELREQNKILAQEKWILGQEKAQLYGQLKQLEA